LREKRRVEQLGVGTAGGGDHLRTLTISTPPELWVALRAAGLIAPAAPLPGA